MQCWFGRIQMYKIILKNFLFFPPKLHELYGFPYVFTELITPVRLFECLLYTSRPESLIANWVGNSQFPHIIVGHKWRALYVAFEYAFSRHAMRYWDWIEEGCNKSERRVSASGIILWWKFWNSFQCRESNQQHPNQKLSINVAHTKIPQTSWKK